MYRDTSSDHLFAFTGGALFVPILATIGGVLIFRAVESETDTDQELVQKLAITQAAAGAVGTYLAYRYSQRDDLDDSAQAFARGGMWGNAVQTAVWGVTLAAGPPVPGQLVRRRTRNGGE